MKKLILVFALLGTLAATGVTVCADPYEQIQGGYGYKSGSYNNEIYWDLQVNSWNAYSHGEFINGNTGTVNCYIFFNNNDSYSSSNYNTNTLAALGDGNGAEVWFIPA